MSFKGKITFAITGNAQKIGMYVGLPRRYEKFFTNIFYGTFGTSELEPAPHYHMFQHKKHIKFRFGSVIADKDSFVHGGAYMDPLKDLLSLFHSVGEDSQISIYYTMQFTKTFRDWVREVAKKVKAFGSSNKEEDETEDKSQEKQKNQAAIYDKQMIRVDMSFAVKSTDKYTKQRTEENIAAFFHTYLLTGKFKLKNKPVYTHMHPDQIINLFHLPTKDYFIKGLEYNVYRKLPYPSNLPRPENTSSEELTVLGRTDYRAGETQFWIKKEDKFRHMYVVGKTGTGKSTFLSNLIKSDMEAGNGLCLLDPHGDLVETCLEHVPNHRINDVILFDISDDEFPVGFNLLQRNTPDEKNRIVSGVVSVFKKMFAHSWGPRLEYVLRNVLLSLVDYPNATLMHLLRMLTDKSFKDEVLWFVKDHMLLKFRNEEFNKRNDKQLQETIGPITNKVGQFLSSPVVRNIFGQYRSKLDLRKAMDEGKILLVNLSKGKIGEDNASMVGALLVTKFQIEAMARANISYNERRDFYLYIDEFQNFATDSFATILSEARKYKLSLIVANQYTSQLDEPIRDAIFGNVGTMISFTLGYDDAAAITKQYKEMVGTNDLISLPRFTAYTRLMIDGISSNPFSMKTNPLPSLDHGVAHIAKIKEQSRQRYAIPRPELERYMADRYNKNFSAQEKIMEKAMLASIWVPEAEIEAYQSQAVSVRMQLFKDYMIGTEEPDAMLFDIEQWDHKAIWYQKPAGFEEVAILDMKRIKGKEYMKEEKKIYDIKIAMYEHNAIKSEDNDKLDIWIGPMEEVLEQIPAVKCID